MQNNIVDDLSSIPKIQKINFSWTVAKEVAENMFVSSNSLLQSQILVGLTHRNHNILAAIRRDLMAIILYKKYLIKLRDDHAMNITEEELDSYVLGAVPELWNRFVSRNFPITQWTVIATGDLIKYVPAALLRLF